MDFPPLKGAFGAEPSQAYIDEQLAHMIIPQLDDEFEQVCAQACDVHLFAPLYVVHTSLNQHQF